MAMAGGERKAWLDRINGRVTSKTVDLSIGGAWSRSKTLAAASSRSPTGISKEEADKQFVAKLAQQERDLCIAYRDVATFRLRWMVKGLDNKMKKVSQAAPNESVDESILRTVCKLVKNPVDSLCKNFTDVEAWRSGGGTILQHSILNDNKEQTRQLIRIRRKEAETEIVQQRQHVEQQLSEERMSINQHAASATRDTESEYQTKLASMAEELQHEEEALALQEQRTTMAKEAAVKSNKNHKQVGDVMRGQQDELRAQVWEMEKRLANLQKEIQTKRETVRGLEKDAAAKTKIANAKEQKNAKAMEKTAKKRMSGLMASRSFSNNRSSAGGGVPPPYQRGRRSGLVMVTPEMATSVDYGEGTRHSTPEDEHPWEIQIGNIVERMAVTRDRAIILLEQCDGHAGKVIQMYQPTLPREDPDGIVEIFNEIDEDGSGTLDIVEVANMCKTLGRELTARELEVAMKAMDTDGGAF